MKKNIAIIATLLSMTPCSTMLAQDFDGIPTLPINRRLCIHTNHSDITRTASTQDKAPLSAIGSPKIVVCLAEFSDVKFTVAKDKEGVKEVFNTFFNGRGIGAGDNPKSVYDYFHDMSNGVFTPEFVIMDPITLSNKRKYYGEVSGSSRKTTYRNEVLDSLSYQLINRIEDFDTNQDGKIDAAILVFPGCGANVGDDEGMHPACWTTGVTSNGVTFATSLVSPELLGMDQSSLGGSNNAKLNGIGVFVHEISHMLGLPDFYDLNYKAPGMDYWSLMDYGEYWHNGYRPTPYTAYERHYMGWTQLVELSTPTCVQEMKTLAEGGSAYIVYNDGNRDEYYVLENRTTNDPWSQSLCSTLGSGMMIYHVDFDAAKWSSNKINTDANRQRMTIIPANGHFEICDNFGDDMDRYLSELRGHLWPLKNVESVLEFWGIAGNDALTDQERTEGNRVAPAAHLHTPNADGTYLMHKPITDIAFDNNTKTISFKFMGGAPTNINNISIVTDASVQVYSLDGRLRFYGRKSDMESLPKGVYVVKDLTTGDVQKLFLGR